MISDLPDMLCSRRKGRIIREFRPADGFPRRWKTVSLFLDRFPIGKPSGAHPSCRQNRPKTPSSLVLSCGRSQRGSVGCSICTILLGLFASDLHPIYAPSCPCFADDDHRSLRFCDFLKLKSPSERGMFSDSLFPFMDRFLLLLKS